MVDRYCRNCGHELRSNDRFCTGCASPVQQTAHVPTPEANVPVSTHSYRQQSAPYPQQASAPSSDSGRVRTSYYWIAFIVLGVLALLGGDNGTIVGLLASITASVWTYRDARSRGMERATAWTIGVFLLWIVFLPLYLFMRKTR